MLRALASLAIATAAGKSPTITFRMRALKLPNGTLVPMEDVPSIDALSSHGAQIANATEPQLVLEGAAYVSGKISEKNIPANSLQDQATIRGNTHDGHGELVGIPEGTCVRHSLPFSLVVGAAKLDFRRTVMLDQSATIPLSEITY